MRSLVAVIGFVMMACATGAEDVVLRPQPQVPAQPEARVVAKPGPVLTGLQPKTWQEQLQWTTVSLSANGHSFCTGAWISKHAVLTAAHCVDKRAQGSFQIVAQPDARSPAAQAVLPTRSHVIHPTYAMNLNKGEHGDFPALSLIHI